jgi:hypothetical protein
MRIRTSALAGLVLLWATTAAAQPWRDDYERQDYPAAAAMLQAMVFEHSPQDGSRYPEFRAIQTLAQLYAGGQGVARDPLTACALSNLGSGAAVYQFGERDPRTAAIQRQVEDHCMPLTADERREAMQAAGCFQPGPAARVLYESGTYRIAMGRSTLTVTSHGRTRHHALAPLLRCPQQVALARHARVRPPKGSKVPVRDFVEIYSWHSTIKDGRPLRSLEWSVIELTSQTAAIRARTVLERAEGSTWPARDVPAELSRPVKFTMHKTGDVRWQMAGRRGLHGVIGRPAVVRVRAGAE